MSRGFYADFSQLEEFIDNWKKAYADFDSFMAEFIADIGERAMEEVMSENNPKHPVDTGALRSSWHLLVEKHQVTLYNPQEYASHVEYGHTTRGGGGWVEGVFMMTMGVAKIQKEVPKHFIVAFRQYLQSKGAV